jgi:multidrug efflux system membrane fusion protein
MRRGYSIVNYLAALVLCGLIGLCIGAAYVLIQREPESAPPESTERTEQLLDVVHTVRLTEDRLQTHFTRRGVLQPSKQVSVHAEATGRVVQRHASVGDRVGQGDAIVELDGALLKIRLDEAQARQKSAEIRLAEADSQLADAEQTEDDDLKRDAKSRRDAARAALDLAETQVAEAEQAYETRIVRAPIDGTVAQVWVDQGELAATARPVAEIIVTDPMHVAVSLTAEEVASLNGVVRYEVRVSDKAPGRQAKLVQIAPMADPQTKRFSVEIRVSNEDGRLRAGTRVDVEFFCTPTDAEPLLPRRALTRRGESLVCFRIEKTAEGHYVAREFEPQLAPVPGKADVLRVRSGLDVGDEVVVGGLVGLDEGTRVRPILQEQLDD